MFNCVYDYVHCVIVSERERDSDRCRKAQIQTRTDTVREREIINKEIESESKRTSERGN